MSGMQDVLVPLVFAVAAVGVVIALATLAGSGRSWREIGGGGLDGGDDASSGATPDQREQEIRQLLGARNARRERRGEAVMDVDAELAALTHTVPGEGLLDEARAVVEARNHRRVRDGLQPLDVDAEIERRLRELT
jgi:hypothetical protein